MFREENVLYYDTLPHPELKSLLFLETPELWTVQESVSNG